MDWKQFLTPAKNMSADEARQFLAQHRTSDFTLLDVRQPGEHMQARIPGSHLVPLPELPSRLEELDRDKPVVVY
jgi:rhodanese-related sulfurtransferase